MQIPLHRLNELDKLLENLARCENFPGPSDLEALDSHMSGRVAAFVRKMIFNIVRVVCFILTFPRP